MIKLTVNEKVFSIEADWSQCLEATDFTSTASNSFPCKYYIDEVEVTKGYFVNEYKRSRKGDIKVSYETMVW